MSTIVKFVRDLPVPSSFVRQKLTEGSDAGVVHRLSDVVVEQVVAGRLDVSVGGDDLQLQAARVDLSRRRDGDAEDGDAHVLQRCRLARDLAVARQSVGDDSGDQICSRMDDVARENLRS